MIAPYSSAGQLLDRARAYTGPETDPYDLLRYLLKENSEFPEGKRVDREEVDNIANKVIAERDARLNHQIDKASEAARKEWDSRIAELAKLHPIEYDRIRVEEKDRLGCQQTTLDGLVKATRKGEGRLQGKPIEFPNVEPWNADVDGAELLEALAATYRRYVILPAHADTLLALWTVHTYAIDVADISPYVASVSPTPECGKTTALRVMHSLAWRALLASNISAPALYRVICEHGPTLLIDEMDSFADQKSELRNILNGGHTRGAHVVRAVGEDFDPRQFDTFGAKGLAAIGKLSPTVSSRSIQIRLRRKKATEKVDKLPLSGPSESGNLCRKCLRWVNDHRVELRGHIPHIPSGIDNRNADNWSVLFTIAEVAENGWPEKAHKAAESLSSQYGDDVTGIMLLADIRRIFDDCKQPRIHSESLQQGLVAIEDGPWSDYRRGKAISPNQIAKLLGQFDIKSKQLRIDGRNRHGYEREAFEDVWTRYLPADPEAETATTVQASNFAGSSTIQDATSENDVAFQDGRKVSDHTDCSVVADENGGSRGIHGYGR